MRKVRIKRNDSTHENIATEQEAELENAAIAIAEKEAAIAERDKRLAELEAEIEKARKKKSRNSKSYPAERAYKAAETKCICCCNF